MKRVILLVLTVAIAFSSVSIPVFAGENPTATISASLIGDAMPLSGEKFTIAFNAEYISSGLFGGSEVSISWPTDVVSLVDFYYDDPVIVEGDETMYSIGNIYNEFISMRTGKFTVLSDFDEDAGCADIFMYINTSARDQSIEALEELTMYEMNFMINEGYTYDDFYLSIDSAKLYLTEDGTTASTSADGDILLQGIEKNEEIIWTNSLHQPGFSGNLYAEDEDGIYPLPIYITSVVDVEFDMVVNTFGDGLLSLGYSENFTANNYFSNSSVMIKPDSTLKVRNGSTTIDTGVALSLGTAYHFVVNVDLFNNAWGITVTSGNTQIYKASGLAFRNTSPSVSVIDAMLLCDNNRRSNAFNVTNVVVIDKTPATIGTMTFRYVDKYGNTLGSITRTGEVGSKVSVDATTITVGGVKYEAPAATSIIYDEEVITIECSKIEVVSINYTLNGAVVGTATVEGVHGEYAYYNAYEFYDENGLYRAESGYITIDENNLTAEVELDLVYEGIVAAHKQTSEAIHALDKPITNKAIITYDVLVRDPSDAMIAFSEKADLADNFFAQSSAYLQFSYDTVYYNSGNGKTRVCTVASDSIYSVEAEIDVDSKTWSFTITDSEGSVIGSLTDISFRNTNVEALDSIVVLDNGREGSTLVVQNLSVVTEETPTETPDDSPSAKVSATLLGNEPTAGEKFVVAINAENISSCLFAASTLQLSWPKDVVDLADCWYDDPVIVEGDEAMYCIGNVYKEYAGRTGKFSVVADFDENAGCADISLYIDDSAKDQSVEEVTELTMYEMHFILKEGYTYEDFYLTIDNAKLYLTEDKSTASTSANGEITLESIEKKEEIIWTNILGQPGFSGNLYEDVDTDGIFPLPQAITDVADVEFDLEIVGNQGDSLLAFSNSKAVVDYNYFASSTVMMKPDTIFKVRNGGSTISTGKTLSQNTVYHFVVNVDLTNNVWGVTVTSNGTQVYKNSNLAFRIDADTLDSMVLITNGNGYAGSFTVKNVTVNTPAAMGTMTFKYVDQYGNTLKSITKTGEVGTLVSLEASTITVGDVEYEAPFVSAYLTNGEVIEVVCSKVEAVTVNYTLDGTVIKTTIVAGVHGAEVAIPDFKFAKEGTRYAVAATTIVVDSANLTATVPVIAEKAVDGVAYAIKTQTYNITEDEVYPYPSDRLLAGTDSIYSTSWGDERYGEILFDVTTENYEFIESATLTLTPGDFLAGQANTFEIYAANPKTFGTKEEKAGLTALASGTFAAIDEPILLNLDLSDYDASEGVLLIYKVTSGLVGMYGASFYEVPALTYVINELDFPTEDPTEDPTEEPELPSEEPEVPSEEPELPSEEPEVPSEEPEDPTEEPELPSEEPEDPTEEPELPSEEPEDPSEEPTEELVVTAITIDRGLWADKFDPNVYDYTIYVNEDETSIGFTCQYNFGALKCYGATLVSDREYFITLRDTTIQITLQMEDNYGMLLNTYTLTIIKTNDPIIVTSKTSESITILLNTNVLPQFEDATVIIAAYNDDDILQAVNRDTIKRIDLTKTIPCSAIKGYRKIMLWKNDISMTPICEFISVE